MERLLQNETSQEAHKWKFQKAIVWAKIMLLQKYKDDEISNALCSVLNISTLLTKNILSHARLYSQSAAFKETHKLAPYYYKEVLTIDFTLDPKAKAIDFSEQYLDQSEINDSLKLFIYVTPDHEYEIKALKSNIRSYEQENTILKKKLSKDRDKIGILLLLLGISLLILFGLIKE